MNVYQAEMDVASEIREGSNAQRLRSVEGATFTSITLESIKFIVIIIEKFLPAVSNLSWKAESLIQPVRCHGDWLRIRGTADLSNLTGQR